MKGWDQKQEEVGG